MQREKQEKLSVSEKLGLDSEKERGGKGRRRFMPTSLSVTSILVEYSVQTGRIKLIEPFEKFFLVQ